MRTALMLKNSAHFILLAGMIMAIYFFPVNTFQFWCVIGLTGVLWLIVRLLANIGQLVYEMRHESGRSLANMERSLHQINATLQEMRDSIDSKGAKDAA